MIQESINKLFCNHKFNKKAKASDVINDTLITKQPNLQNPATSQQTASSTPKLKMCKITETEYKCGHSTSTSRPCEKAKESNSTWGCLRSSKAKYCSHPREIKKEHEGLCDKCRGRAASKTRQGRSASKSREPAPAHNDNIKLVKGSATERHDFFLQQESRGRSRDKSRSEFEGTRSNKRSSMINLPHDKAAVPPLRGSITNYKSKPLPNLPPNASKSSKIGGSFASTSRSTSRDGRPLVPPPRHGPYIPDRDTTAVPAPLRPRRPSESQVRPARGNIRESQMFTNPGPAPSIPYPVPQQERGRNPDPRPLPLQQQQQKGQVSYPPNASRHNEVPRRRLSKTRHIEAVDDSFGNGGRSRSASKTRERSLSRSRHGSKHDKGEKKHHQKQPSAASSFMNKLKAGLGYDEYDDDGSDSDEWVCARSRALERGENIPPSATATSRRRMSYQAGDYYMQENYAVTKITAPLSPSFNFSLILRTLCS
ncbi:hypothetical protein GE21DRAFT_1708 [Neurospora crassa]|uniref:Uncharacterized protein n=2 Tax=Neurospora crassa TaxID=5141 RepID=Q7SGE6_NEUCR|nr:hypothetical protein NCU00976 [Neurospora crassa OR74A]EAA35933.1 hypothetical protein NCU00976 [Neurospora crassa OR74A]KHE81152.1 hypothetical protein GE21DRAFT_1708 [Neurospora crassa]CAE76346.1 hypothetical protein [Neurospora crassa]|eukprot:XP_965169.1 hypothetical protein NCU00976 [Neurospora crassa OR74A]